MIQFKNYKQEIKQAQYWIWLIFKILFNRKSFLFSGTAKAVSEHHRSMAFNFNVGAKNPGHGITPLNTLWTTDLT